MKQLAYFYTRIGSVEKRGVDTALLAPVRNDATKAKNYWKMVVSLFVKNLK